MSIPGKYLGDDVIERRRRAVQAGDWISSGNYDKEKFDAPIRGNVVSLAILHTLATPLNSPLLPPYADIGEEMSICRFRWGQLSPRQSEQLRLNAAVALEHHECYDGKGWPRGVRLDPTDPTADVTFFDFISGWFVNKSCRGAHSRFIAASTPAQVLAAIDARQALSLQRSSGSEPMYNRHWVQFCHEHLDRVNEVVVRAFPDVAAFMGSRSADRACDETQRGLR